MNPNEAHILRQQGLGEYLPPPRFPTKFQFVISASSYREFRRIQYEITKVNREMGLSPDDFLYLPLHSDRIREEKVRGHRGYKEEQLIGQFREEERFLLSSPLPPVPQPLDEPSPE